MSEKCARCGKTVYVVEKLAILNQVWHKGCFKCTTCNMTLNMKSYSATGGKPYCKAHYPMPKGTEVGETAPKVNMGAYNTGNEDQTTGEAQGMNQTDAYEPNYGGGAAPGGYDQGGGEYYGEQQ